VENKELSENDGGGTRRAFVFTDSDIKETV
jgi:hypothetical protein